MNVCIAGSGALSGYYGGLIQEAGRKLSFLVRDARVDSIRQTGLTVKFPDRELHYTPNLVATGRDLPMQNFVLLGVKLYDLETVCKNLLPCCNESTTLLTLQNGIDAYEIAKSILPESHILAGSTFVVARRTNPTVITFTQSDSTITFGSVVPQDLEASRRAEEFLSSVKIPSHFSNSILRDLWIKFIWFTAYAGVAGSYLVPLGEIGASRQYSKELFDAFDEGIAVGHAENISLPANLKETLVERIANGCAANPATTPSLLRDLVEGRKTEIEFLSGKIVRLGIKHTIPTPIHQKLYEQIKARENKS